MPFRKLIKEPAQIRISVSLMNQSLRQFEMTQRKIRVITTNWEIQTPYAGPDGILEHRCGKFPILKLKSSHLPYTAVKYFPFVIVASK